MTTDLKRTLNSMVQNLRNTVLYRSIEEWSRKSAFEIRETQGLERFSVTSSDPVEMYQNIKKLILSQVIHEEEILQFLLDVPRWVGFSLNSEEFQSGQQVIGAAKDEALSMLWLLAIPRLVVSPTMAPEDYAFDEVRLLIRNLLESDESRSELALQIVTEMESRGISDIVFQSNPIGRGYSIDIAKSAHQVSRLIALVLMKASGCPFDIDRVFALDEAKLIEETTSYIITMHAKSSLKNQITGSGPRKPFDWPLVGNLTIFAKLLSTIDVLRKSATQMSTSAMFVNEFNDVIRPWSEVDFLSYLVQEIADYYATVLRTSYGRGKNRELALFVDLLKGEHREIAERLVDSQDRAAALALDLSILSQRARTGEKPQITPERRFGIVLSSLKKRLENMKLEDLQEEDLIDNVNDVFDAIVGVVEHHKEPLGEESERFTQALCFETSYRLLQLLKVGKAVTDLPWVSRFIAEESARNDITSGDISHLNEEHRIRRIVSAYAGGVTYLVLQGQTTLITRNSRESLFPM